LNSLDFPEIDDRTDNVTEPLTSTFQWIWKDETLGFSEWLDSDEAMFWIQGKPGSGKSTLMKHILDRRKIPAGQREELVVGFFFNDRRSLIERTIEGLLRSFLRQVLSVYKPGFRHIIRYFSKKKDSLGDGGIKTLWEVGTLRRMFFDIIKTFSEAPANSTPLKRVLFIVDALDECDHSFAEFRELVNDLLKLLGTNTRRIKFCCSSRPEPRITDFLARFSGLTLQERNSEDIKTYVRNTAAQVITRGEAQDQAFIAVTDEIIEKADGIFLWAKLVLKELLERKIDGDTISELREVLQTIPTGLIELFTRMIDHIPKWHVAEARTILRVVLCAQRQLTLREVREAVAFGSQQFKSHVCYQLSETV
jgi:hypothetical protein